MVTERNALDYILEVKNAFVNNHLAPMLKTLFANIKEVSYEATKSQDGSYVEAETVTVNIKNGSTKKINVSGDSCLQMTKDVLEKFD